MRRGEGGGEGNRVCQEWVCTCVCVCVCVLEGMVVVFSFGWLREYLRIVLYGREVFFPLWFWFFLQNILFTTRLVRSSHKHKCQLGSERVKFPDFPCED